MRFDVTLPTPGAPTQHRGINADQVAELVDHAATHGLRLHIRPHQIDTQARATKTASPSAGTGEGARK